MFQIIKLGYYIIQFEILILMLNWTHELWQQMFKFYIHNPVFRVMAQLKTLIPKFEVWQGGCSLNMWLVFYHIYHGVRNACEKAYLRAIVWIIPNPIFHEHWTLTTIYLRAIIWIIPNPIFHEHWTLTAISSSLTLLWKCEKQN